MFRNICLMAVAFLVISLGTFLTSLAADHKDAPISGANPAADINDVYAFQNPNDPDKVILVMTVNPLTPAGVTANFSPNVTYKFLIDSDGDYMEDATISINFDAANNPEVIGPNIRIFTGMRDDPFYFDLDGFKNGLTFTGTDFFAGKNVSAIVVEVAQGALKRGAGNNVLHIWAETRERGKGPNAPGPNIDRMGNPAINTVFIPSAKKDAFNQGEPKDDPANFTSAFGEVFGGAFAPLAGVLLPDVITLDLTKPSGFLNGRRLQDDVIDAELGILNSLLAAVPTTDGVNSNDKAFLGDFPFLAEPW